MKKKLALILCLMFAVSCFAGCGLLSDGIENDEKIEIGAVEENPIEYTYANEKLGFACVLDDSWTISSQEENTEMAEIAAGAVDDEELSQAMDESKIEFSATAEGGACSINVVSEKLNGASKLLTEKAMLENSMEMVKAALEDVGISVSSINIEEVEFAGDTHKALRINSNLEGIEIEQLQVIIKKGDTACTVTFASMNSRDVDDMIEYFIEI